MSSTYGDNIHLSIFGQSHGPAIGMTLDGVPAGLAVDIPALEQFLNRRAPGKETYTTTRKEQDIPQFLSGIVNGYTCGAPITAVIYNQDANRSDYESIMDSPRPGHADFTAQMKYKGYQDIAGGGHFSGRLTAALCIAGGLCKQWLEHKGISIASHITSIAGITDDPVFLDWVDPQLDKLPSDFPVVNAAAGEKMRRAIIQAKEAGDSVGGTVECITTGLPAGIGDPMFGGMESRIAKIVYGIPAIKGLEFGSGFSGSALRGSENNDPFQIKDGRLRTQTNNSGGILGGITTGMPLVFQVAVKPTPSISKPQNTVSLKTMTEITLHGKGRHDPCIVPRVAPVIEAAAAIAIFDAMLA